MSTDGSVGSQTLKTLQSKALHTEPSHRQGGYLEEAYLLHL